MACSCCLTFAEHLRSIRFLAVAPRENRRERVLSKDLAAFKTLTEQGVEPARIDGCAELVARDAPVHVIEHKPDMTHLEVT